MNDTLLKTVALIGRPNVGKSTLFNRLIGKRMAIETDIPGTTRDRLFGEVTWGSEKFELIDVAGIEMGTKKEIDRSIQEGVEIAIDSADLILFLVDWNDSANEQDKTVARMLRKTNKKVILVVNKADNIQRLNDIDSFKRLGNFTVIAVSGITGKNTGDLLDEIVKELETSETITKEETAKPDISLAIIGRPNVGKSTLLNSIVGEKRVIVSEEAGTTRDTVSVSFVHKAKKIVITDTAGIRRPSKIGYSSVESYSVIRTYKALSNCDVAVLLVDASEGLVALDVNILGKAKESGKGIILAINKIDLVEGDKKEYMAKMLWQLQDKLNFAPWLPIVFVSAANDENINSLLNQVVAVSESRHTIITEEDLNKVLENAKNSNFQLENIRSLTQKSSNPPVFEIRFPQKYTPHYTQIRYLENKIRDAYPMSGTPIYIDSVSTGRKRRNRDKK